MSSEKVAIVTGGAQGLGKDICRKLLENGVKVCFCDIKRDTALDTLKENQTNFGSQNVMFVECDVTKPESFDDLFRNTVQTFGPVNILINNAGIVSEGTEWRRCIDVNLTAYIHGCKLADTYMSKNNNGKGGTVLNIASLVGIFQPNPLLPVYGAAKAGVIGLTRCLAQQAEDRDTGIKYLAICPGPIDTELLRKLTKSDGLTELGITKGEPLSNVITDTVDTVAKTVIQMLETDNNNGGVVTISPEDGSNYVYGDPSDSSLKE